jgi:hypothetical protein
MFAIFVALAGAACARKPAVATAVIPAIPPGEARLWIYRLYQPSESLNLAAVSVNGALAGYAQPAGGAFYRDLSPGPYHVTVASYGIDFGQSSDLDLAAGDQAYVRIESLDAWTTYGDVSNSKRDTFYARLVDPRLARAEIAQLEISGGR